MALAGRHLCRRTLPLRGAAVGLELVTVRHEMSGERQVNGVASFVKKERNNGFHFLFREESLENLKLEGNFNVKFVSI